MVIKNIIKKIKDKRTLSDVDDKLVKQYIDDILKKNKKIKEKITKADKFKDIEKSKELKQLIKESRNELNKIYGIFQDKNKSSANSLLKEIKTAPKRSTKDILKLHLSSKERLDSYPQFYEKIFEITGKPDSILDLACGLNPFSFEFMKLAHVRYYAIELNQKDVDLLQGYFDSMDIKGKAIKKDITKDQDFPKADICFAFKIFDIIDNRSVIKIIKSLKCKYLVATFPTITARQQKMRFPRRMTFERLLKRQELTDYTIIEFKNEIIYIISLNI